jgi:pimeloyl-ACP methyl ester carboxylesterase
VSRLLKVVLVVVVVLAALAAVNAAVLDSQTKPAEVTADGGRVESTSSVDVQVFDSAATGPGPEGAPIVLLHCFGCSSQWWNPILPALNERHRVIRVDLIGHGGSEKPQSGYEIEAQAAAVAEVLNSLDVEGATIVGHSLGGMVAASLAEQASELVGRLALIGVPSEAGESSLPFTDSLIRTPVIGQALWRIRLDPMIKSGYGSAFAPGTDVSEVFPGDPDRVVEDNRAMTYNSFTQARERADDFMAAEPVASRIAATGVPLIWIDGSEDQIIDAAAVAGRFRAVPGSVTKLLEGVGHSPAVEAPAETAELVLDFAAAAPSGGSAGRGGRNRDG